VPDARLYDLVINCVRALSLAPQALSEEVLLHETLFATFKAAYALPEMGRMELYRIFNELRVDMRTLLMDQKAEHLEKLLDNAIEAKAARIGQQQEVKEYLVGMLISRDNFALEDLLAAMAFQGTKISLEMLLDEPSADWYMKRPIMAEFPTNGFVVASDIQLKKGAKAPRMDVAVVRREKGDYTLFGFAVNSSARKDDVARCFARAGGFLERCDGACVAISPMTYVRQHDLVRELMEKDRRTGVWVVNRHRLMAELRPVPVLSGRDMDRSEVFHYINNAIRRRKAKAAGK
jgi:hypothetical protein